MRILEKVERRLGEKLFLKGERCLGPKCAQVRHSYPPGVHGKGGGRRRGGSEYGLLLRDKQKIRYLYGLDDKDIRRYAKEAALKPGVFSSHFLKRLEGRLDNVVYRSGFSQSRRIARQMIGHGHIMVNGKRLSIPSYQVKKGDIISIKDRSLASPLFSQLETRFKKYEAPKWLGLDKNKKTVHVTELPEVEDIIAFGEVAKIREFYLR